MIERAVDRGMQQHAAATDRLDATVNRLQASVEKLSELVSKVSGQAGAHEVRLAEGSQTLASHEERIRKLEVATAVERWKVAVIVGCGSLLFGTALTGVIAAVIKFGAPAVAGQ